MLINCVLVIVDDDESIDESLPDLLREFGFSAMAFRQQNSFWHAAKLTKLVV